MPLQPQVTGARHMIVSGHWLATQAGHAILEAGGNAVDAAVAAGIALGVLHSDQVNVAGVAPMIVYLADRDEAVTIAGLGAWPRAARLETFTGEHGGTIPLGLLRTVVHAWYAGADMASANRLITRNATSLVFGMPASFHHASPGFCSSSSS